LPIDLPDRETRPVNIGLEAKPVNTLARKCERPPSRATGTVRYSRHTALASGRDEAVNGRYKTELIRRRGPGLTVEQVELATLEYVGWWKNQRLHG
jgi:hypothetical protein